MIPNRRCPHFLSPLFAVVCLLLSVCQVSAVWASQPPYWAARLENPAPHVSQTYQSGIGVISGWVCEADVVEIEFNGDVRTRQPANYGTARGDTAGVCGDTDNGFGLLFNWNLLGDGVHTVRALADGWELDLAVVTVTTLGEEFAQGLSREVSAANFPDVGSDTTLVWQESQQNFVITAGQPRRSGGTRGTATQVLENPQPGSYQSGIGVISGWVCEAGRIEIEFNGEATTRQPAGYGTARGDTAGVCGDTDNGFGLLFNWNLLGDGVHTVRALADGVEFARSTVTVTTLGEEFAQNLSREVTVADFPAAGSDTTLVWQESQQNFVITGRAGPRDVGGTAQNPVPVAVNTSVSGYLESSTDVDYFEITVTEAGLLTIEVTGTATVIELRDSTGRVLARSTAQPPSSQLSSRGAYRPLSNHTGKARISVQVGPGGYSIQVGGLEGDTGSYDVTVQHETGEVAEPSETFTDPLASGGQGPEMVIIPAGTFRMGCLNNDGDCDLDEFPVHNVTVPSFALSKYEVTFAEWDACVDASGCNGYRPDDQGLGRSTRPVNKMNWSDAQAYVAWLSAQTGENYRLPSEAEWEYAARAGTTTKYHWGNTVGRHDANCARGCDRPSDTQTVPVGIFPPNEFGLYDVHGNVAEWVQDCWNESYVGAPSDGSAWESGDCSRRVTRGGSIGDSSEVLRSAARIWFTAGDRVLANGFRIARSLSPTETTEPPTETTEPPESDGFAPADQQAFNNHFAGKRVVVDNGVAYWDIRANGRFTLYEAGESVKGTFLYNRVGPNAARLSFDLDDIGISPCTADIAFISRNHGTYHWKGGCTGSGTWQIE